MKKIWVATSNEEEIIKNPPPSKEEEDISKRIFTPDEELKIKVL